MYARLIDYNGSRDGTRIKEPDFFALSQRASNEFNCQRVYILMCVQSNLFCWFEIMNRQRFRQTSIHTHSHTYFHLNRPNIFSTSSCNNRVISVHHDLNGIFWKKYYSSTELSERAGGRADDCNSRMSISSRKYEMKRVYWLNNRE